MSTNKKTELSKNNKQLKKPVSDSVIKDEDNETRAVDDKLIGDDKDLEEAINPPSEEDDQQHNDSGYNSY